MGQGGSIPMFKAVPMFSWSRGAASPLASSSSSSRAAPNHWNPPLMPQELQGKGEPRDDCLEVSSTTGSTDWAHLAHGQNLPAPCLSNIQPHQHDFGPSLGTYINMISSQE